MTDESESESGYRLFLGLLAIMGLIAIAFASWGLITVLSGSDTPETVSVPEAFACDQFHGDPAVNHEAPYGINRNATVSQLASINATERADGFELIITVTDPAILGASARHADGTAVPVTHDNATVQIEHDRTESLRLWIDSADGGTITRSELDICPP